MSSRAEINLQARDTAALARVRALAFEWDREANSISRAYARQLFHALAIHHGDEVKP